jgi:hypothetical protein
MRRSEDPILRQSKPTVPGDMEKILGASDYSLLESQSMLVNLTFMFGQRTSHLLCFLKKTTFFVA